MTEREKALAVHSREAGAAALTARGIEETRDAMLAAKRWPRDEEASFLRVKRACERVSFASRALYEFPRGGKTISGPSVYLARELARCWGNLDAGFDIVSVDEDYVHVRGYCRDLEGNTTFTAPAKFRRLIQRRAKGKGGEAQWVEPDERDFRELVNRHGAIALRNAILECLPADVVEEAQVFCRETTRAAAAGDLEASKTETIRKLVVAFDEVGVSKAMLEVYLGHQLDLIVSDEVARLRAVYTSIREGNSKVTEHFAVVPATPAAENGGDKGDTKKQADLI